MGRGGEAFHFLGNHAPHRDPARSAASTEGVGVVVVVVCAGDGHTRALQREEEEEVEEGEGGALVALPRLALLLSLSSPIRPAIC